MDKEQSLYNQLMEECNEISIIASKIKRFGIDSYDPTNPEQTTNRVLLARELNDLLAAVELINDYTDLAFKPDHTAIERKKQKIARYENISRELGKVK